VLSFLGWAMNAGPIRSRAVGLALLAAAALAAAPARADVIRLRADLWCPYNCEPGADRPGYMVEIAREVFAAAGHEIEYRTLNWVRSLEEARHGTVDGVIAATAVEAAGFVLPLPLGRNRDGYAMRRGGRFDPEAADPF
jgi:polar amino acid transport system substrate-binding protein